jgi:hypothetical protein
MFGIQRAPTHPISRHPRRRPAVQPTRCHRPRLRVWEVESLEGRVLLSTFTVDSLADTGTGSGTSGDLRYVVTHADQTPGDNTIDFTVTGTIALSSVLPDLGGTGGLIDVEGPGAASLTVARSGAAGTPKFRIFTVASGADVKIVGLTIAGGSVIGQGGGIDNDGTLTVSDSIIANNSANGGSRFGTGGGIFNDGTLTISDSTIANNSGGVAAPGAGGGVFNSGTLSVSDTTIANNSITGQFSGSGGGIYNTGLLTVTDSTLANNSATGYGGGIASDRG